MFITFFLQNISLLLWLYKNMVLQTVWTFYAIGQVTDMRYNVLYYLSQDKYMVVHYNRCTISLWSFDEYYALRQLGCVRESECLALNHVPMHRVFLSRKKFQDFLVIYTILNAKFLLLQKRQITQSKKINQYVANINVKY